MSPDYKIISQRCIKLSTSEGLLGATRGLVAQNQTSQLRRNKIALIHASLQ